MENLELIVLCCIQIWITIIHSVCNIKLHSSQTLKGILNSFNFITDLYLASLVPNQFIYNIYKLQNASICTGVMIKLQSVAHPNSNILARDEHSRCLFHDPHLSSIFTQIIPKHCAYALCSLVFYLCKCISHHTKHLLMYEDIHRSTGLGLPLILKVRLKKICQGTLRNHLVSLIWSIMRKMQMRFKFSDFSHRWMSNLRLKRLGSFGCVTQGSLSNQRKPNVFFPFIFCWMIQQVQPRKTWLFYFK